MSIKITFQQLIDEFSVSTGRTKAFSKEFIKDVFITIQEGLRRDENVNIKGLGIFKLQDVAERETVNPKTGKASLIQAHKKVVFKPEKADATGVEWATLAINNHDNPWIFTLDKSISGFNRCVYVRTDVWVDEPQTVKLEIGSDDAVKVWLNGKLVHSHFIYRGVEPAQDIVEVTLNQGWNTLMLKIVQGGGEWGFCAGFRTPDGGKIEGLKFRAE